MIINYYTAKHSSISHIAHLWKKNYSIIKFCSFINNFNDIIFNKIYPLFLYKFETTRFHTHTIKQKILIYLKICILMHILHSFF
jgi:hypothetical protein